MSTCSPGRKPVPNTLTLLPIVTVLGTTVSAGGAMVAVAVRVGEAVLVLVAVLVRLGLTVGVVVGVIVLVTVGVRLAVGVVDGLIGVADGVSVAVLLGDCVGEPVCVELVVVAADDTVGVCVKVAVAVYVDRLAATPVGVDVRVTTSSAGAARECSGIAACPRLAPPIPSTNRSVMMIRARTPRPTLLLTPTSTTHSYLDPPLIITGRPSRRRKTYHTSIVTIDELEMNWPARCPGDCDWWYASGARLGAVPVGGRFANCHDLKRSTCNPLMRQKSLSFA